MVIRETKTVPKGIKRPKPPPNPPPPGKYYIKQEKEEKEEDNSLALGFLLGILV